MKKLRRALAQAISPVAAMRCCGMDPDPWQAQVLTSEADRIMLLASRQSGKSTVTAFVGIWQALYRGPALILLLSPSLRQSSELFRRVVDFYEALKRPVPSVAQTTLKLELANGSRVVSLPATEGKIRGYSDVALLVIDEGARVPDELYHASRPMLAVSGGKLICLSTPFGRRGWFHSTWISGEPWLRLRVPATECARISPEFLEEEKKSMPVKWFKQEYMVEFAEPEGAMFGYDIIHRALTSEVKPLFPY